VASYGLSFLRNLILARLLTKADFGLAALFANALAMLEVASRMSFGQQVVQSAYGADRTFRDTAHAFQLCLALVGVCLLTVFGLVGVPLVAHRDVAWAFAALALVPLAGGFSNLDIFREQRRFNQRPVVLCEFVPQLLITLATWPLALWLGDFRVVLCILVGKPVLGLLMTHVLAAEPYGLCWRRDYFRAMAKFGWPLVLNGLLMFASLQADQFLVAGLLSTQALASYALAFSLASVPWYVFVQPAASLMLPVLSRVQDQPDRLRMHYRYCVELAATGAVALTLPLIVFGEQFVTLLYGRKYAGTGELVAVLGAATAFRFLRFAPAVASMACADTRNQLNSNLVRAVSLPLAVLAAGFGGGLVAIAGAALVAEIAAGALSIRRLARRQGVPMGDSGGGALYLAVFLALAGALIWLGSPLWSLGTAGVVLVLLIVLIVSSAWVVFPQTVRPLARGVLDGIRGRKRRLPVEDNVGAR
jgi:O-antigen/teichoic acid export membrane protein